MPIKIVPKKKPAKNELGMTANDKKYGNDSNTSFSDMPDYFSDNSGYHKKKYSKGSKGKK